MKNKNLLILILFFTLASFQVKCLSDSAKVSILSYKPGNEIYTIFGHTAIRITDNTLSIDDVYNFGSFDFSSPFFYLDFLGGNIDYFLSVVDYTTFKKYANIEHRKIHEQILKLNLNEKEKIYNRLESCYNSSERFYKYDFFYDNCATRVRDIIFKTIDNKLEFDTTIYGTKTFRQLLSPYISNSYWINFGINLFLGKNGDKMATINDYMFLPDYLMLFLEDSDIVIKNHVLIDASISGAAFSNFSYGLPWIIVFILIVASLWSKTRKIVFYLVTSIIAIIGLSIVTISFLSENPAFASNFNICWTLPAFILLFIRSKNARFYIECFYIVLLIAFSIMTFSHTLPQECSFTFIPWIILLMIILLIDIRTVKNYTPQ